MPRQIDNATLQNISGADKVSATSSLLDNVLKTVSNKAKMKEAQQLSQLRSMQIQQTGQELSEWQQQADIRQAEIEVRRRTVNHGLKTLDKSLAHKEEMEENAYIESEQTAAQAGVGMVLMAKDDTEKDALLDKVGDTLPAGVIDEMRKAKVGSPEWTSGMETWINDVDFMQQKALQRLKNAGASGSTTNPTSPNSVADIMGYFAGMTESSSEIRNLGTAAQGTAWRLQKTSGIAITPAEVATVMVRIADEGEGMLLGQDSPYRTGNSQAFIPFSGEDTWNPTALAQEAERRILERLKGNRGETVSGADLPPGLKPHMVKQAMEQTGMSREQVIADWTSTHK